MHPLQTTKSTTTAPIRLPSRIPFRWVGRHILVSAALLCIGASCATAAPEQDDDWSKCGGSADRSILIESCTAIIESGEETPKNIALALGERGLAHYENGEFDAAIADYSSAIDLKAASNDILPILFLGRAEAYFSKGEYARAIADDNVALHINPNNSKAIVSLGDAYLEMGDYRRAVSYYTRALRIDRGSANPALNNRAFAFLKLKRFDAAIADYDGALKLAPDNAQALYGRGIAERAKGKTAAADADSTAAKKINPDISKAFGP